MITGSTQEARETTLKNDLLRIQQCIADIEKYMAPSCASPSDLIRDVVNRKLQIIAQAARRLPISLKDRYAHLNWKDLQTIRQSALCGYLPIESEEVERILYHDLAALKQMVHETLTATIEFPFTPRPSI